MSQELAGKGYIKAVTVMAPCDQPLGPEDVAFKHYFLFDSVPLLSKVSDQKYRT